MPSPTEFRRLICGIIYILWFCYKSVLRNSFKYMLAIPLPKVNNSLYSISRQYKILTEQSNCINVPSCLLVYTNLKEFLNCIFSPSLVGRCVELHSISDGSHLHIFLQIPFLKTFPYYRFLRIIWKFIEYPWISRIHYASLVNFAIHLQSSN